MTFIPSFWIVSLIGLGVLASHGQRACITVRNLDTPGAIVVENNGLPLSLSSRLAVERKREGRWITANVFFELTERCGAGLALPDCVEIASGGSIKPVPWNGYTCSGQCPRPCRSNHYAGPGEFRFVVYTCDRKHRFVGPAFTLPPEKGT